MNVITASDRIDHIGYETENGRTQVRFDLSALIDEFPGGFGVLTLKRPDDEQIVIPTDTEMDGSFLVWTVSAYELERRGILRAQISYSIGEVIAKTDIYKFMICDALDDNAEPVPEGWVEWVNGLLSAASEVNGELQSAKETLNDIRQNLPEEIEQAVSEAVETVLESEQDPTVPAWAKQPVKPAYTAAEVGALPDDTFVPEKTSDLINDVPFYTKPVSGIPASDIDEDIITDISGKLDRTEKGSPGGVATLDNNGQVPASQLPAYVDDVQAYSTRSQFPRVGEAGIIYIATTTNRIYHWIGGSYIELSPSISLGETSDTAFRGDRGKLVYDQIVLMTTGTSSDIGKALSPKRVVNGVVTEWKFVEGGGGGGGGTDHGIPAGGYAGDILMKYGDDDYAVDWVTPANNVEEDNTRPITAAAVYTEVGNINALLATI